MHKEQDYITLGEYVKLLLTESYPIDMSWLDEEGCVEYGIEKGWLEPADRKVHSWPVEKRHFARITHEYLKKELGEADEDDWSAAAVLKDLYDCHVCVNHVAQMYVKGIMDPVSEAVFGMQERVTTSAAKLYLQRMMFPKERTPRKAEKSSKRANVITSEEAMKLLTNNMRARLIDVRTLEEYTEGHIDGAVNIPMATILKNPYSVASTTDIPVFFYCEEGYQSTIAANCTVDAGFHEVYSFAYKIEK